MRPIAQNRNNLIIGFDPDLTGCGIAEYDVADNFVLATHTIRPFEAVKLLLEINKQYRSIYSHCIFRIEQPDQRSAYGGSSGKNAKGVHGTAFSSGESSAVAKIVIDELHRAGAYVEVVSGSKRYNLSTPKAKRPAVLSMPLNAQVRWLQFHSIAKGIPSKANAALALALFPSLKECKYNNDAVRDALFLAWPEWVYFHAR